METSVVLILCFRKTTTGRCKFYGGFVCRGSGEILELKRRWNTYKPCLTFAPYFNIFWVCMCTCVCMYARARVCMCTCMPTSGDSLVLLSTLFFWDSVFHWIQSLLYWIDWLTSKPQGYSCLCLPSMITCHHDLPIRGCRWYKLSFSCLHSKWFTVLSYLFNPCTLL